MRHRKSGGKLGMTGAHRRALRRNMAEALFRHERIRTTIAKAKELKPYVEKLITLSKKDTVHARRLFAREIQNKKVIQRVFTEIGPRFEGRQGGYTRVIRLGTRLGDAAEMAIIELVDKVAPIEVEEGNV